MALKKTSVVTNLILILVFSTVFGVSFFYQSAVPIYSGNTENAIYNGNRQNKNVSLMFNVYENTKIVNSIIDVMDSFNAKCTFFVGGCWADDNQATLTRIVEHGHELANHGYFHKDHKKLNFEQNKREIENTSIVVKSLSGAHTKLFAPPSGSFGDATLEACSVLGYKLIMWSKDTIDWRDENTDLIFSRATKDLTNGDLILMHPKQHTLLVLPKLLEYYINNGYKVVSVSENIK